MHHIRSRLASASASRHRLRHRHHLQRREHKRSCPSSHLHVYRGQLSSRRYSSSSSSLEPKEMTTGPLAITFMTDVEGDGAYFDRFVRHSKLLAFRSIAPSYGRNAPRSSHDSSANRTEWNLGEWEEEYFPYDKEVVFVDVDEDGDGNKINPMLVYGGDVWDKGGFDLYVMRQLLSLHRRYPNRVHFLMGNRDINKLRIVDELGICASGPLPRHDGVYWLKGTVCSGLPADPESNNVPSDSAANRLKWMLRRTMGSVDAFELRRNELNRERVAIMNAGSVSPASQPDHADGGNSEDAVSVSDSEVAQSYIRSCCPHSGVMSQYLSNAKLAMRIGPVLFLHGALPITPECSGFPTPWIGPNCDKATTSLNDWISAVNDFASDQVKAWKEFHGSSQTHTDGVWATEGGYFNKTTSGNLFGALIQYGMGTLPDRTKTRSCVYNSWMHDGLPRDDLFGSDESIRKLSQLFKRERIQLIISGHQPVGDAPWPIQLTPKGEKTKILIMPCDTSFSGDTSWISLKNIDSSASRSLGRGSVTTCGRGEVAFSEPLIQLCPTSKSANSVKLHGCLSDGEYYETVNIMDSDDQDLLLGRNIGSVEYDDGNETKEGVFWVKGKMGEKYLCSTGKGFNVFNSYIRSF